MTDKPFSSEWSDTVFRTLDLSVPMFEQPDTPVYKMIRTFRYKPGWMFTLSSPRMSYEKYTLTVRFRAPHSMKPGETADIVSMIAVPPYLDDPGTTDKQREYWLRDRIEDIERHEVNEFFEVNGHKPFFPDHKNAPYAVRYIPRPEPAPAPPPLLAPSVIRAGCTQGPGCSCRCEPTPGGGCLNAAHCTTCSNKCHVNCNSKG